MPLSSRRQRVYNAQKRSSTSFSLLERTSAFFHVYLFMAWHEIFRLYMCNCHLRRILAPLFVSDIVWELAGWSSLTEITKNHVRKMYVVKSCDPAVLAPCTYLKFGDQFNNKTVRKMLQSTNLRTIIFGFVFDQVLVPGALPPNLTRLQFGFKFNQPLGVGVFPDSLLMLYFGYCFNQELKPGVLPPSLTDLTFGTEFTHLRLEVLPSALTALKLCSPVYQTTLQTGSLPPNLIRLQWMCDYLGAGILPSRLQQLRMVGNMFTKPILHGVLPLNLTSLNMGENFNQVIELGVLPSKLTSLNLGPSFQQTLHPGVFPLSLQKLIVGQSPLRPGCLPNGLTQLRLGSRFKNSLESGVLPSTLTSLDAGGFDRQFEEGVLPSSLRLLIAKRSQITEFKLSLPQGLHRAMLGTLSLEAGLLPSSLAILGIALCCTPLALGLLPAELTYLHIVTLVHAFQPKACPTTLTDLRLVNCFSSFDLGDLPPNLLTLVFGTAFHQSLASLPRSLVHLELGKSFNYPIKVMELPSTLAYLDLGYAFNQTIEKDVLPSENLLALRIGREFKQPLKGVLPPELVVLIVPCTFDLQRCLKVVPAGLKIQRSDVYLI